MTKSIASENSLALGKETNRKWAHKTGLKHFRLAKNRRDKITGIPIWSPNNNDLTPTNVGINIRCGHVVRDFESEAKTRCNFQFR